MPGKNSYLKLFNEPPLSQEWISKENCSNKHKLTEGDFEINFDHFVTEICQLSAYNFSIFIINEKLDFFMNQKSKLLHDAQDQIPNNGLTEITFHNKFDLNQISILENNKKIISMLIVINEILLDKILNGDSLK